jgi:hypothetical protein
MQKAIGPSFASELAAYGGLLGQHFSWQADGTIEFFPDTPASVVAGVTDVYAAHNPLTIPPTTQAQNAISAGLTVTSTSTPAIDGTFPVDQATQTKISSVETFIERNGVFPGSAGTSLAWFDITGTPHVFPSTTVFSAFATAVANYVADLDLYGASAPGATLPPASVTIA